MKRISFILAATLLVAAVSCNKEVNPAVDNDQPVVEDNQPVSTVQKMSFTAYADNGDGTRTSLNEDNSVTWAAGEAIYVFDGKAPRKFVSTNTEPAKVVTFEGEAAEATTYYAVSPAATMSGNTITATIPVFQTATAGTFDPKAAISVAVSGTDPNDPTALKFKNAAAAVKFKISNDDVTKIRLDAINGEKLSGKASITLGSDSIPNLQMVQDEAESCVILTGAFVSNTDYVIAVAPGTYSGGFRLTLIKADGKFASIANTNSQTLGRRDLMNFGTMPAVTSWKESKKEYMDEITYSLIGVSGTNYTDWSDKSCVNTSHSGAIYKGQTAGGNEAIQMRSDKSTSGIISTTSGGKIKSISVIWNDETMSGRELSVYGSNSSYSSASNLYNSTTQGDLIGTIKKGESTSLTVTGDYTYIGLRSKSGAMYLDKITIVWESNGDSAPTDPDITPSTFEVTPTSLLIPLEGGSSSFTVNSTIPWTISLNDESIASYSTSVEGNVTTVTASMGAITSGSRSAVFTVTPSEGNAVNVTFTQKSASIVEFVAGTDKGSGSVTKDGVTISMSVMDEDVYKAYKSSSMSVSAANGKKITSIVLTSTNEGQEKYGPGCFIRDNTQPGSYSYDGNIGTWTGNATSVSLYASLNQVRMTKIEVTIE